MNPLRSQFTVIRQFFQLVPRNLIPKLARKHGVDKKARTFSPTSHVVALMYAQLTHSISLNDICDALRNHSGALSTLRGSTPPSRNRLSHANKVRSAGKKGRACDPRSKVAQLANRNLVLSCQQRP